MSLDVFPAEFPCIRACTSIPTPNNPDVVSCTATQAAGGCPWKTAVEKSPFADGRLIGMLGSPCSLHPDTEWIERLEAETDAVCPGGSFPFYGDDPHPTDVTGSIRHAHRLAGFMEDHAELWASLEHAKPEEAIAEWGYAAWWLRFTAEHGHDGCAAFVGSY